MLCTHDKRELDVGTLSRHGVAVRGLAIGTSNAKLVQKRFLLKKSLYELE